MKGIYKLIMLLFLSFYTAIAQERPKRHTVSSGETLFSIAKKYNITPYDLQKVNPSIINGIRMDDVLVIPEVKITPPSLAKVVDSKKASVPTSSISHTVKSGETKYGLSKRFGLTINQLESQNPQITSGLIVGQVLEIYPSTTQVRAEVKVAPVLPSKPKLKEGKTYQVTDGETLLSIASANGLTTDELAKANSNTISGILKIGQVIWIPGQNESNTSGNKEGYIVEYGDTKFSLSRRFNTSVRELERKNPHIVKMLIVGQIIEMSSGEANKQIVQTENTTTKTVFPIDPIKKEEKTVVVSKVPSEEIVQVKKEKEISAPTEVPSKKTTQEEKEIVVTKDHSEKSTKKEKQAVAATKAPSKKISQKEIEVAKERSEEVVQDKKAKQTVVTTKTPSKEITHKENELVVTKERSEESIQDKKEKQTAATIIVPSEAITQKEKKKEGVATITQPQEVFEESSITTDAPDSSDDNYIVHRIQPNETIYGLAQKAGMSIPEFRELNPQLKGSFQLGSFIKMPKDGTKSKTISNTEKALVLPKSTSNYTDLRTSANTSQSKKLLFFLPFSETDYQNYAIKGDNFNNVSDDFKRIHLEFYKGANMAIDSLRRMKLNLDIDIVEAQSTNQTSKIKSLIQEQNIEDYDAIVLPFYKTITEEVIAFTENSKIPVITASTITYQNHTNNLYNAIPSINQQRLKVLRYMMEKQAHVIVLSDVNRVESKDFITHHIPNADFVFIKKNGSFSENELISKFKKDQLNFVVIDSDRRSIFLNVTNALLGQRSNHNLQLAVLEGSLIPDDSDVSQKRYQILKMIFPSLIPAKSTASSKQFLSDYQKKYNLLPSANVMLGFDITFDSLLRLLQQQSFENSVTNDITEYTQLKFDYKKNTLGGYSNEGIYILQYDSEAKIRDAH